MSFNKNEKRKKLIGTAANCTSQKWTVVYYSTPDLLDQMCDLLKLFGIVGAAVAIMIVIIIFFNIYESQNIYIP